MVVGLKVYILKDKETYEQLRMMVSGISFFRHTNTEFFIKTTKNPTIEEFLKLGLIELYL
jgi:uncharacterized membrane protein